jgi:ribosomal-protein-serine acetyltransferase
MRKAPPLLGERVQLAPVDPADGPDLWHAVESSRVHLTRWLPWVPFNDSEQTSQRYAEACAEDWDEGRALRFCIRLRSNDDLVGVVGLDNCVHMHKNCDLGYWLCEAATGYGLMTEAARVCIRFAFEVVGIHRIRCAAATENGPSRRVIERLGFRREGTARSAEALNGHWVDHAVYSLLASDPPVVPEIE